MRPMRLGSLALALGAAAIVLSACNDRAPRSVALKTARATSSTSVLVTLTGKLSPSAVEPSRFRVTAPDGSVLPVTGAYRLLDGRMVVLATGQQRQATYALWIISPDAKGGSQAKDEAATFEGTTVPAPVLAGAVALDATHILLSFADRDTGASVVLGDEAASPTRFSVRCPDLEVKDAAFDGSSAGRSRVVLTTAPMGSHRYVVTARGIVTHEGVLLDPGRSAIEVPGMALAMSRRYPLAITQARNVGRNRVLVEFSEPLGVGAGVTANYRLVDPSGASVAVHGASLGVHRTQVRLDVEPLRAGARYLLTVQGVADWSGRAVANGGVSGASFEVGRASSQDSWHRAGARLGNSCRAIRAEAP